MVNENQTQQVVDLEATLLSGICTNAKIFHVFKCLTTYNRKCLQTQPQNTRKDNDCFIKSWLVPHLIGLVDGDIIT